MGQTIRELASRKLNPDVVFGGRFVVEICEAVHVHYRNLRLLMSVGGFHKLALGFKNSLERWEKQGNPEPEKGRHIELCRSVPEPLGDDSIRINLNKNLYPKYEGKIFSEGAGIQDDEYIHVKIRDMRLEMSKDDFNAIAEAFLEARNNLASREMGVGAD